MSKRQMRKHTPIIYRDIAGLLLTPNAQAGEDAESAPFLCRATNDDGEEPSRIEYLLLDTRVFTAGELEIGTS